MKPITVLSLFDGIAGARVALDLLGVPVKKYYASEIDKYAIKVAQSNWDDIIHVGDVSKLRASDFKDIDLIIGGSPCQGLSVAGMRKGLHDPRSRLFWEFVRLKNEINPRWWFLENVNLKNTNIEIEFNNALGVPYHRLDSASFTAQMRDRFYWTNIPKMRVSRYGGEEIVLIDVIDEGWWTERDKAYPITATFSDDGADRYFEKRQRQGLFRPIVAGDSDPDSLWDGETRQRNKVLNPHGKSTPLMGRDGRGHESIKILDKPVMVEDTGGKNQHAERILTPEGKSYTLVGEGGGNTQPKIITYPLECGAIDGDWNKDERTPMSRRTLNPMGKSTAITASAPTNIINKPMTLKARDAKNIVQTFSGEWWEWRKLTVNECCYLQAFPQGYCDMVSATQGYRGLGNAYTCVVIAYLLMQICGINDIQGLMQSAKWQKLVRAR